MGLGVGDISIFPKQYFQKQDFQYFLPILCAEARLPFNPEKSWAGSAAMFLGGAAVSLVFSYVYAHLGYFEMDGGRYASLVAMAAIATVVEALPTKNGLDDNISVPLVTAVLGCLLLPS